MAITTSGTSITFNNSTVQSTAWAGINYQFFGANGTFTVPTGITSVTVYVFGGGGGGSGARYPQFAQGGGTGGAACAVVTGLTPGAAITVTVGSGGAGGGNGVSGSAGGTSSFGSYVSCTGGSGGGSISSGSAAVANPGSVTLSGAQIVSQSSSSASTQFAACGLLIRGSGVVISVNGYIDGCASLGSGAQGGCGAAPPGNYAAGTGAGSTGIASLGPYGASANSTGNTGGAGGPGVSGGSNGGAGGVGTGSRGGGGGGGGGAVYVFW
jgi:hypothetical protein